MNVKILRKDANTIKMAFIKKHWFHIGLIVFSLAHFALLFSLAGVKSLWHDDIYQLFFSWDRTLGESFATILKTDLNPPLWPFISFLWLKIAPYGTAWLKLPAIILTVAAGYIFALSLKEVFNKRTGLLGAFVFAVSPLIVFECAYTFRAYGLYLFASSLIVYAYIKKTKNPSVKNRIFFGISVFIIAFTHYFGAFLCVFLGAFDLVLAIKKKQKFNFFIEYVIVAVLEIVWLILQITTITDALSEFWPPIPTYKSALELIRIFLHNSRNSSIVFWALALIFLTVLIVRIVKRGLSVIFTGSMYFRFVFLTTTLMMLAVSIVYCNINPASSLWVYRYFFCLYPMMMFLFISMLVFVIRAVCLKLKKVIRIIFRIAVIGLLSTLLLFNYSRWIRREVFYVYEPFEQSAELIMSEDEIKNGERVLVYNTTDCGRGWMYYLSQNNKINTDHITLMDNTDYVDNKEALLSAMSEHKTVYIYAEHLFSEQDKGKLQELRQHMMTTHTETVLDDDVNIEKGLRWAVFKYQIN